LLNTKPQKTATTKINLRTFTNGKQIVPKGVEKKRFLQTFLGIVSSLILRKWVRYNSLLWKIDSVFINFLRVLLILLVGVFVFFEKEMRWTAMAVSAGSSSPNPASDLILKRYIV